MLLSSAMGTGKAMDFGAERGAPKIARLKDISTPDTEALRRLSEAHYKEFNMRLEGEENSDLENPRAAYIETNGAVFVLRDGDDIVGSVAVLPDADGVAQLKRLQLLPAHRGRGMGQVLLKAAMEYAHERGLARVSVEAHEKDADMREALRKLDFHPTENHGELLGFERASH